MELCRSSSRQDQPGPGPVRVFLLWPLYTGVDRPVRCLWLGDLRPWHLLSPVTQNSNICFADSGDRCHIQQELTLLCRG